MAAILYGADYFGSTVNLAARLQGQSVGGDIVISASLAEDAGVKAVLGPLAASEEAAEIRGFDRPAQFRRLKPAAISMDMAEFAPRA